jgi:CheY-like chemotaxis protein
VLFKAGILKRRVYENYDLQTLLNEGAIEEKVTPEMLKILLELEGYEVVTTRHAQEVLPLLDRERPDVLVMDFHLGSDDAGDVLREIRGNPEVADSPVVVMSGMECSRDAEKAGADVFLLKPFAFDQLLEILPRAVV